MPAVDQETIDALKTRKTAILAEIAGLAAGSASLKSKPGYSVDGQSFDWNGARVSVTAYRKGLYDELKQINEMLAVAEGNWETETVMV